MKYNRNILLLFSFFGFFGSFLMFCGDMLFYFERVSGANYNSIARMGQMPVKRLIAGGLMGPISAVFSIAGTYVFYILFKNYSERLARVCFLSLAAFFVFAAAYHSVFANLGFFAKLPIALRSNYLKMVKEYLDTIYIFNFALGLLWTLLFLFFVIFKKSILPRWLILFTPTLWILLAPYIKNSIPYPFGGVIYGGWINLSFGIFYFLIFLFFYSSKELKRERD